MGDISNRHIEVCFVKSVYALGGITAGPEDHVKEVNFIQPGRGFGKYLENTFGTVQCWSDTAVRKNLVRVFREKNGREGFGGQEVYCY